MSQLTGLAIAGAQLGLQSLLVKPKRRIGTFVAQVTVEESHSDETEITEHPVEMGARIADHAYMRPAELTIICGWSDSPSNESVAAGLTGAVTGTTAGVSSVLSGAAPDQQKNVYKKLLALQNLREPFSVVTGKREYENMMVKSIKVTTNKETENALMATIVLRQVFLVTVNVVSVSAPAADQASPGDTAAPENQGMKQLKPATTVDSTSAATAINPRGTP